VRYSKASNHNRLSVMREKKLSVEELLLPHLDDAYNLTRWIVQSAADAQAIVQEAYTYASEQFEEFRGDDARIWLFTIVRNRAYRWIRGQRNLSQFSEAIQLDPADKPSLAPSGEERKRDLQAALGKLPVEFREILMLHDIEGWSYAQLAALLELSRAAVASRLNEARLFLRREMTDTRRSHSFPSSASSCSRSLISRKPR
jgi:RNA polymerase sigma-70 factor, ECF subfamily